ncbi:MAG: hypothetical protein FJY81_05890 [Candidatus Aminicenantes bacterium]|nr:hypothetical protein [Candidatus Aminicenantes bacterium]
MTMFSESCLARNWRLLESAKKTPTMRKDREMIVTEKKFLALYCQRLFSVSRIKYLIFWRMAGPPFR